MQQGMSARTFFIYSLKRQICILHSETMVIDMHSVKKPRSNWFREICLNDILLIPSAVC